SRVSSCHQQREIVRFRSGVDEVADFQVTRHFCGQLLRVSGNIRMQIDRGGMLQRLILAARNIDNIRVAVAHAYRHDSAERVEIPPAVLVPNVLHFPFHKHERLFVVEENSRIQEFLAQTRHFIRRWAAVFFRMMVERWKRRLRFHCLSLWPEAAIWQGCSVWQKARQTDSRLLSRSRFDYPRGMDVLAR